MPGSVLVNGVDLEALGVYVSIAPTISHAPRRRVEVSPILHAMGGVPTTATFETRTVTLTGTVDPAARTVDALHDALHEVRDLFLSGQVDLTVTDSAGNSRRIRGLATTVEAAPRLNAEHFLVATVADLSVTLLCSDPTWRSVEPSILSLPAGTRVSIPLGTAPSRWIMRAMASDPVFTYRSAGGTALWTLTITKTLTSTEDYITLDATTGLLSWSDNGTVATDWDMLAEQQDFPKGLDPQDGHYATSQWPTMTCSVAAELLYWRRWL